MRELLLFLFFFMSLSLSGKTYYISPIGNDSNSGTISRPFFTLNKTWAVVSAGDTVYLRGGTYQYNSSQYLIGKNGTSSKIIRIWAYPGEIPVITKAASFNYTGASGIYFTGNYFHWKGIEITGFSQLDPGVYTGFRIENASNNIFEQLNSHHNGNGCVISGNSDKNLVLNCDFHHNQDPLTSPAYDNADGLDICFIPDGATNIVRGCRFWWNTDDGIDLWRNEGFVAIDSCWSWNNGYIPDTFTSGGNGNGFKLGITTIDLRTTVLRVLRNCVAYNNRARGFEQNGALAAIRLHNNVAYLNGAQGFWFGSYDKVHILKNNISYKDAARCFLTSSSIVSNNTFLINNTANPALSVTDADFASLDGSQLTRARKTDGSLPDIDFMHLAPGSDLIDAGIDVGLPFSGKAPDLGPFELSTTNPVLNQLPVISISSPTKGSAFTSPATVTIEVNASDPDGSISKVELFNGTVKIGESTTVPYSFTLKALNEGDYSLKAVATDNLKAITTSTALDLQVISYDKNREFINLYPNPNDGRFTIKFASPLEAENYTVSVVNIIGKTVYQESLQKEDLTRQFDLSHLNPGIYILMISTNVIVTTQKFIKG